MTFFRKHNRAVLIFCILLGVIWGLVRFFIILPAYPPETYGHGFDYMNGWSTTDFTGYRVTDGDKLFTLDHPASYTIEKEEDMPVLDGAEACYPLYSALAKAVYRDIGQIEQYHTKDKYNGMIVTFSNSVHAYQRLVNREADMVFAARPSENQKAYAARELEQIRTLPIGKEAFIFFTEEDNPVDNLSSQQIRDIYSGKITNWKQVGGKWQKIIAYQRPEDSGSQVMMKYFMGDTPLKKPQTVEYAGGMMDVVSNVVEYHHSDGAIAYTFRYFLTGLAQEEHVRILSVDGVAPTAENIRNGSYPATVDLVCATLVSNEKPKVQEMLDFLLSDDGQVIVEGSGYAALDDRNVTQRIENEIPDPVSVYVSETGVRLSVYPGDETIGWLPVLLEKEGTSYKGVLFYGKDSDPGKTKILSGMIGLPDNDGYDVLFEENQENGTFTITSSGTTSLLENGMVFRKEE